MQRLVSTLILSPLCQTQVGSSWQWWSCLEQGREPPWCLSWRAAPGQERWPSSSPLHPGSGEDRGTLNIGNHTLLVCTSACGSPGLRDTNTDSQSWSIRSKALLFFILATVSNRGRPKNCVFCVQSTFFCTVSTFVQLIWYRFSISWAPTTSNAISQFAFSSMSRYIYLLMYRPISTHNFINGMCRNAHSTDTYTHVDIHIKSGAHYREPIPLQEPHQLQLAHVCVLEPKLQGSVGEQLLSRGWVGLCGHTGW